MFCTFQISFLFSLCHELFIRILANVPITHTAFADFLILPPWDWCSSQKIDKSLISLVHCKIDYFYYLLNAFESNSQFQGVKIRNSQNLCVTGTFERILITQDTVRVEEKVKLFLKVHNTSKLLRQAYF